MTELNLIVGASSDDAEADKDGSWSITDASNCAGYATAWSGKSGLSYDEFNVIF